MLASLKFLILKWYKQLNMKTCMFSNSDNQVCVLCTIYKKNKIYKMLKWHRLKCIINTTALDIYSPSNFVSQG